MSPLPNSVLAGQPGGQEPEDNNEQSPSGLLSLPAEFVLGIMEFLPEYQRLILGQTCRTLRAMNFLYCRKVCSRLCHHSNNDCLSRSRLSADDHFHFLCILARDLPDRSACESCLGLHAFRTDDNPHSVQNFVCPAPGVQRGLRRYTNFSADHHGYRLEYRHVQTILKYTRMQRTESLRSLITPWHLRYLNRLLRPFSAPFRPVAYQLVHAYGHDLRRQASGCYTAVPKVVGDRLVVRSTWSFWTSDAGRQNEPMSPARWPSHIARDSLGWVDICPHQSIVPECTLPPQSLLHQYWTRSGVLEDDRPTEALHRAVGAAFVTRGTEFRGHCHACETDFSVMATHVGAVIHSWHHMGTESDHMEGSWAWQTDLLCSIPRGGLPPGSARSLWERDDPLVFL